MDKERQIEEMAKITGLCDYPSISCEQCRLRYNMHLCMHRESMKKLINAGYGDTKAAVREFAEKLEVKLCECVYADEDIHISDKWFSSKEMISEVIAELLKKYEVSNDA